MNKIIIKSLDRVIVSLLVTMGVFSSCNKDEIKPMYGVPEYGVVMPKYGIPMEYYENIDKTVQDIPIISEIENQDENIL